MDHASAAGKLSALLDLRIPPIAVAFRDSAPTGVSRVDRAGPAGCAYWKWAAEGRVFYTEASDHYNCPVGTHTHGLELPSERAKELDGVVSTMVGLQYIRMDEVAALPRVGKPFRVAVYAPLAETPVPPDVILVRGNPRQIMLLAEAARAAGLGGDEPTRGRPACAMIAEAMRSARGNTSLGCIGNRVYTELGDDELYSTIPGAALSDIVEKLETIVDANRELARYHEERRRTLTT
jgi:uncharacterized protein (DUF169 family)